VDGPAIESSECKACWYINGVRHRIDGPAVEWSDGSKEWWINGERIRQEEFTERFASAYNSVHPLQVQNLDNIVIQYICA
jgi:hypothetical protein